MGVLFFHPNFITTPTIACKEKNILGAVQYGFTGCHTMYSMVSLNYIQVISRTLFQAYKPFFPVYG